MKLNSIITSLLLSIALITSSKISMADTNNTNKDSNKTRVVLLGTGHPGFEYNRDGQSILITVNKEQYLFDAGPGYMKNFNYFKDKPWLPKEILFTNDAIYGSINKLFLTHLDSDHVLGVDEFLFRPWVQGRSTQPIIYGPKGTKNMVEKTLEAFSADIGHRTTGSQPSNLTGFKAIVNEIDKEGVVYQDKNVIVTAFKVHHGSWPDGTAFGYRIKTADKTIVISGDTNYDSSPKALNNFKGADILIHEVVSEKGYKRLSPDWQTYMLDAHTTSKQLAELANKVRPKKLVLIHTILFGQPEEELVADIKNDYKGEVILGKDLMVIE